MSGFLDAVVPESAGRASEEVRKHVTIQDVPGNKTKPFESADERGRVLLSRHAVRRTGFSREPEQSAGRLA